MTTFKLMKTTQVQVKAGRKMKTEDAYTYASTDGKHSITFHFHPTRAFVAVPLESHGMTEKLWNDLVKEFYNVQILRLSGKTFEEVIATLDV
jgi:hypothetical protein